MTILDWMEDNLVKLIISGVAILVGIIINRVLSKQIEKHIGKDGEKEEVSRGIKKITKLLNTVIVLSIVISQFSESTGALGSIIAVMSGTIIGFASTTTLSNAIAGLIIMVSKPFQKNDRIDFNGKQAEVKHIEFMFTKLKYLDGTIISIPNQEMLNSTILNYSKSEKILTRKVTITLGYDEDPDKIKADLIETVSSVEGVLQEYTPKVSVSGLLDYAVEYTCRYKINDVIKMAGIGSKVRLQVLKMCQQKGYDLTMPILHKNV